MRLKMNNKDVYIFAQQVFVERESLKEGTLVRIIRTAKDNEMGWNNNWISGMDETVGCSGTIQEISDLGIVVSVMNINAEKFTYPFFCIEKQEYKFKPFDRVIVRALDCERCEWQAMIYSHKNKSGKHVMVNGLILNNEKYKILPFEGNEALVGTQFPF